MTADASRTDPPGHVPGGSGPVQDGRVRLYPKDVAAQAGVQPKTIHKYNSLAKRRRADGDTRPSDLPPPDGYEPARHGPPTPWWYQETIDGWLPKRNNPPYGGKPRGDGSPAKPTGKPVTRRDRATRRRQARTRRSTRTTD